MKGTRSKQALECGVVSAKRPTVPPFHHSHRSADIPVRNKPRQLAGTNLPPTRCCGQECPGSNFVAPTPSLPC